MTSRQRMEAVWQCQKVDRVPFVPAVYEQKAFMIGQTPSRVSRDPELFYRAMMVEYETYHADALVIGMDVYNLEAEAMGCTVTYYEGEDASIPGISPENHVLKFGDDLSKLKFPDPRVDGRMPVNLEVAKRLADFSGSVPVRGALSGPLSLALNLLGLEEFYMGMIDDPDYCQRVLSLCSDVIIAFGKAYLDCGIGVIMFDSQASPELLPPPMYESMVLPQTRRAIEALYEAGEQYCPLIIGGNTTRMLEYYLKSGSKQILCDYSADWPTFKERCVHEKMAVRRNVSPITIQKGSPQELAGIAQDYLREAEGMDGFILGTAVVPYGTPSENVQAVYDVCCDYAHAL